MVQDWGTSLLTAQELGEKAKFLVDLSHHAPNVNMEMIVSRLIHAGKLGGVHFNDSKYGDDDLDSGPIEPYRLFLVWNELVDAEGTPDLDLSHMIDQSHNLTDPIESLMISAVKLQRAYVQASLVDRAALAIRTQTTRLWPPPLYAPRSAQMWNRSCKWHGLKRERPLTRS